MRDWEAFKAFIGDLDSIPTRGLWELYYMTPEQREERLARQARGKYDYPNYCPCCSDGDEEDEEDAS